MRYPLTAWISCHFLPFHYQRIAIWVLWIIVWYEIRWISWMMRKFVRMSTDRVFDEWIIFFEIKWIFHTGLSFEFWTNILLNFTWFCYHWWTNAVISILRTFSNWRISLRLCCKIVALWNWVVIWCLIESLRIIWYVLWHWFGSKVFFFYRNLFINIGLTIKFLETDNNYWLSIMNSSELSFFVRKI